MSLRYDAGTGHVRKNLMVGALLFVLGVAFTIMRIAGAIDWSWWLVTAPFLIMTVPFWIWLSLTITVGIVEWKAHFLVKVFILYFAFGSLAFVGFIVWLLSCDSQVVMTKQFIQQFMSQYPDLVPYWWVPVVPYGIGLLMILIQDMHIPANGEHLPPAFRARAFPKIDQIDE
jgi:hypothetical protein